MIDIKARIARACIWLAARLSEDPDVAPRALSAARGDVLTSLGRSLGHYRATDDEYRHELLSGVRSPGWRR